MSLVSYPLGLPKPLQKNYRISVKPAMTMDEPTNGKTENRLISYNAPFSLSCSIMLTTVLQYQTWLGFLNDLNSGNDWFSISMLGTDYRARIQSGKWSEKLTCRASNKIIREISFTLDLEVLNDVAEG